jgi:hypothetical protein
MKLRLRTTATIFALTLFVALTSARAATPPTTRLSEIIAGVSWDFDHTIKLAHGSDLWPVTWGADDLVYTGWGDGGGFEGDSDSRGRVSLGFASVSGMPPDIHGANLWGDQKHGFAQHQQTFGGKPVSLLSIDHVLYAFTTSYGAFPGHKNPDPPEARLAWSTGSGATWTQSDWKQARTPGVFFPGSFVNFGRDYAGARDEFVYIYGIVEGKRGQVLSRIQKDRLKAIGEYQFFAGINESGTPRWEQKASAAVTVIDNDNPTTSHAHPCVIYDAPLKRYICTWSGDETIGGMWLLDAPEPWGPWTVVATNTNWGGHGEREALLWSIPTKWISTDGKTFWCIYSAGRLKPNDGDLDSFNLIKATLTLKPSK